MEFRFDFYKINKCGYYESGSEIRTTMDVFELFEDILRFSQGKKLYLTKTFDTDSNNYATYIYDLVKNTNFNEYLLVTWNETHSEDNRIASVARESIVGDVHVDSIDIPNENIPGFPTYFWILPEHSIFATIRRIEIRQNGQSNLQKYIYNFLKRYSKYCFREETNEISNVDIKYRLSENSEPLNVSPHFETTLARKATDLEFLRSRTSDIRNLIIKDKLTNNYTRKKKISESFFEMVGFGTNHIPVVERIFKVETGISLNIDELNLLIDQWKELNNSNNDFDMGFKLSSSNSPIWLSNSIRNLYRNFNIQKDENNILNTNELFGHIIKNRNELIRLGILIDEIDEQ